MDPLLQKTSENMPSNVDISSYNGRTSALSAGGTNRGVRAAGFRDSLCKRNIYIDEIDASSELVKRAKEIITTEPSSPDIDIAIAQELAAAARQLQTGTVSDLVARLGAELIPAMKKVPHQSLQGSVDRLWSNAVEVPLGPDVFPIPPPLPKPKPDLVFGYSKTAFDTKQLSAMNLLVDESGRSYPMPDGKVRFPFLVIEFKSQATGGNHFVATNQVANAGAIAMEGALQLARRISAEGNLDSDEPQFFSLSIDNTAAYVNVHWLSQNAESGAFSLHMTQLQRYWLDADGFIAINRAVKNILDYGVNERLPKICGELDTFAQKSIEEMAIIHEDDVASKQQPEKQGQQTQPRRRGNARSLTNRRPGLRKKRPRPAQETASKSQPEEQRQQKKSRRRKKFPVIASSTQARSQIVKVIMRPFVKGS